MDSLLSSAAVAASLTLCNAAAKAKGGSFESGNRKLKDTPPTYKSKKVTSTLGV
jgi:hypothetical protein